MIQVETANFAQLYYYTKKKRIEKNWGTGEEQVIVENYDSESWQMASSADNRLFYVNKGEESECEISCADLNSGRESNVCRTENYIIGMIIE